MAYQIINAIVRQLQPELTAAEAHGMAAGMLCGNGQTSRNYWLSELFQHTVPETTRDEVLLANLFEETSRSLDSDDFEFYLFLPTETEASLSGQVSALKSWCHGFLMGLGITMPSTNNSIEVMEILKDIAEFTRLDSVAEGDEDEAAFIEVTEYLRAAALLIKYEFCQSPQLTLH